MSGSRFTRSIEDALVDSSIVPGARHHQLLNSNEVPQDAEAPFIQSVTSRIALRLSSLDAEISQVRDRLTELEEERASISDFHTQNRAILSPLRRMPSEVLSEIFGWTLPTADDTARPQSIQPLVIVGRVSIVRLRARQGV
ncbi:hypothetical protein DFH06DRAFT_574746 [Mycena polygramma]|nr:hypothetical protein DFH06DRAFT_574746 [Mycena polygramma]